MFNKTQDIVQDITAAVTISGEPDQDGYYEITIPATTLSQLYFYGDISKIIVNDKEYKTYADGFTDLGTHSTNLTIKAKSDQIDQVVFAKIEVADIQTLAASVASNYTYTANNNSNTIKIEYDNTAGDKYLFVPLTYLNHYTISVNGQTQDTTKALGGYIMVTLEDGQNHIEITLKPQFAKISLIISLVGVLLFALFFILNHFFHISDNKVICWIGTVGALAIVAAVAFLIYLKPLVRFITGNF